MSDVNSFRKKTLDGVTTYFYNGKKVSAEEFKKQGRSVFKKGGK